MFKIGMIRVCCWCLTFAVLIAAWWYLDFAVNQSFDYAEDLGRAISRRIASLFGTDPEFAEVVALEKMHMDRTIVFGTMFILSFMLVLWISNEDVVEHGSRVFLAILMAHIFLAVMWIEFTGTTRAWYAMHYDLLRSALRSWGLHKFETIVLRMGGVHSILVFGEALLLVWALFSLVRRGDNHVRH